MKTYFSHKILGIVERLVDAPERTLTLVSGPFTPQLQLEPSAGPAPDHVMLRLENVFEALSELPFHSNLNAALDLACDVVHAELPSEAVAAGAYDIDADEVRIVAARGMEQDLLRGALMSRQRCFAGRVTDEPFVTHGGPGGADWLGCGEDGTDVLLCPIVHDSNLLGLLAIANPLCVDRFEEHDLELVSYVASQLATFMQALRQRASMPAPARGAREP